MRIVFASLSAAVAFALTLSGCNSATPQSAGTPPPSASQAPAPSGSADPSPTAAGVPDSLKFTATTVDGAPFDAAMLAGKPVVFWFWASWCPNCQAAAKNVNTVAKEHQGKVNVVGVGGLASGEVEMKKFVSSYGLTFPQLADDKGEVWRHFGVVSQEYYVILDASGAEIYNGLLTQDELKKRVAELAADV